MISLAVVHWLCYDCLVLCQAYNIALLHLLAFSAHAGRTAVQAPNVPYLEVGAPTLSRSRQQSGVGRQIIQLNSRGRKKAAAHARRKR